MGVNVNWYWFYEEASRLDEHKFRELVDFVASLLDEMPIAVSTDVPSPTMAINSMLHQEGLTGCALGNLANDTDPPLRTFDDQPGVQPPVDCWDPLAPSASGDVSDVPMPTSPAPADDGYYAEDVPIPTSPVDSPAGEDRRPAVYAEDREELGAQPPWDPLGVVKEHADVTMLAAMGLITPGICAMVAEDLYLTALKILPNAGFASCEGANCTDFPLRTFDDQPVVQPPANFWDPLASSGFGSVAIPAATRTHTRTESPPSIAVPRSVPARHAGVIMLATMGHITQEIDKKGGGICAIDLNFCDIPNALVALKILPIAGWMQIFPCEYRVVRPEAPRETDQVAALYQEHLARHWLRRARRA